MEKKNNINKKTFTVPEGYFEQLNKNILSSTVENSRTIQRQRTHILGKFGRAVGYAAAIAVIFILAIEILMPENNNYTNIANIETNEIEFIDNILNSYTIDDYTFYCYLTDTDLE